MAIVDSFVAMEQAIRRIEAIAPTPKREMTCEDRARAAWGNLAVDRPGLSFETVYAVICPDEQEV